MTKGEARELMRQLQSVFDVVRLVDVHRTTQYYLGDDGELLPEPCRCYALWGQGQHCESCVCARALTRRGKATKFEFVGREVYQVTAKYLEIEGQPWVLELINEMGAETLFGPCDRDAFLENRADYNRKLYLDPLTGAYNRRYYEERLRRVEGVQALAMMDLDHFKAINDAHGHPVGDDALRAAIQTAMSCVRSTDTVVRYGGDEFLMVFPSIPQAVFARRLEQIRERVTRIRLDSAPALRLSVSIGGRYGRGRVEDMLRQADDLLYRAKTRRNCVQVG